MQELPSLRIIDLKKHLNAILRKEENKLFFNDDNEELVVIHNADAGGGTNKFMFCLGNIPNTDPFEFFRI